LTAFEYFLEKVYFHEVTTEKTKTICPDSLNISYVDSQGPGLVRDARIGFFLNPSSSNINSMGFLGDCHNAKNLDNELRIGIIGDSFSASTQVDIGDTWPELLKKTLAKKFPDKNIKVLNFAAGGHGLDQQNEQLKHAIKEYSPDLLIHSIYLGNDFTDTDYNSFYNTQTPHRKFPDRNYLVIDNNKTHVIKHRLDYYMLMNFFSAIDISGRKLYFGKEPIVMNSKWMWNDSENLKDRFLAFVNYKGEKYNYTSHKVYPLTGYKSSIKAINLIFTNNSNEKISINILRHPPQYFNWNDKKILAGATLSNSQGVIVKQLNKQYFTFGKKAEYLTKIQKSKSDSFLFRTRAFIGAIIKRLLAQKTNNVINGHFDDNIIGWLPEKKSTISSSKGRLRVEGVASVAYQKISTIIGRTYKVSVDAYLGDSLSAAMYIDNDNIYGNSIVSDSTKPGHNRLSTIFTSDSKDLYIQLRQNTIENKYVEFDNVTIEEYKHLASNNDTTLRFNLEVIGKGDETGIPYVYQIYSKNITKGIKKNLQVFEKNLQDMKAIHSNYGKVILLTIPSAISASQDYWNVANQAYFSKSNGRFDRAMPEKIFQGMANINKLDYSSFYDFITKNYNYKIENFYSIKHRHFTIEGHQVYEEFVRKKTLEALYDLYQLAD
jgi:hypothetical protein